MSGIYDNMRDDSYVRRQVLTTFLVVYDDVYDERNRDDGLTLEVLLRAVELKLPPDCESGDVRNLLMEMGQDAILKLFPCDGEFTVVA